MAPSCLDDPRGHRRRPQQPYYPETQDKDNSFTAPSLASCSNASASTRCRHVRWPSSSEALHNLIRLHEAGAIPTHLASVVTCYPLFWNAAQLKKSGGDVRKAKGTSQIHTRGYTVFVGKGLIGENIARRLTNIDGVGTMIRYRKTLR